MRYIFLATWFWGCGRGRVIIIGGKMEERCGRGQI